MSKASDNAIRLAVMHGDGIGPEITAATSSVLGRLDRLSASACLPRTCRSGWPRSNSMARPCRRPRSPPPARADGVILGPVDHNAYPPVDKGGLNPSGELRRRLDLYANIRPARSRPGFPPKCGAPVDLVIVRENTEGFYADRSMHLGPGEFMPTPDLAMSLRKISRDRSTRIAEAAFRLAARRERRKVTAVHKANVLRVTEGPVPRMRATAWRRNTRRSPTRSASSTPWRRSWCATPACST